MKFYNREYELARLREIASPSVDSAHLMVITGRRRVGKTELTRKFAEDVENVLYFFVSKKKPLVLLEEFKELLAVSIPILKQLLLIISGIFSHFCLCRWNSSHSSSFSMNSKTFNR